jgi:hypothetical protein
MSMTPQSERSDGSAVMLPTVAARGHHAFRSLPRRRACLEELCQAVPINSVMLEIARLAERIEGEQAAKGIVIA